jgi:hypothetical protein
MRGVRGLRCPLRLDLKKSYELLIDAKAPYDALRGRKTGESATLFQILIKLKAANCLTQRAYMFIYSVRALDCRKKK